jgi:hypothetical protein
MIPGHDYTAAIIIGVSEFTQILKHKTEALQPGSSRHGISTEGEIKTQIQFALMYPVNRICYCDTLGVSSRLI